MRRFSLILLQLAVSIATIGQSCLPEGIIFSTQSQIDSFAINYPGCSCIEGDVQILGPDISDLEGLGVLDSILGEFTIGNPWKGSNQNLYDLDGLENLKYIGGEFVIHNNENLASIFGLSGIEKVNDKIKILGNPLVSLSGLEGIDTLYGGIELQNNDELIDLTGLDQVKHIKLRLSLFSNDGLLNLSGLENLQSLSGILFVQDNDDLLSLTGLDNLNSAGGIIISSNYSLTSLAGFNELDSIQNGLSIENNTMLESLDGLSDLNYIHGGINIENNESLVSLSGLAGLNRIEGDLRLNWNNSLTSLAGLDNIQQGSISDLYITNNQVLSECEIENLCDYLLAPNGSVNIYNNDTGCNNPHEIAEQCGISLPCLPYGNYYFFSQADVDSFPSFYLGCSNLQGTVRIEGSDIFELESLSGIDTINGRLYICGNPNLSNLMGLHNLKSISKDLYLGYWECGGNPGLSNMVGLNSLKNVEGSVLIMGNSGLTSFIGFDSLNTIGYDLEIIENRSIKNLEGFNSLNSVSYLDIGSNDSLLSLEGLENLVLVDGGVELANNPMLISLDGIENIDADSLDFIWITDNISLSECAVKSVCDYLQLPGAFVKIEDNVLGCNSPEEVEAACEVGIENVPASAKLFRLYPNPASDILIVEINGNPVDTELTILDLSGRDIVNKRPADNLISINVLNFPGGIYFVRLKSDRGISVQKFVKF